MTSMVLRIPKSLKSSGRLLAFISTGFCPNVVEWDQVMSEALNKRTIDTAATVNPTIRQTKNHISTTRFVFLGSNVRFPDLRTCPRGVFIDAESEFKVENDEK